MGRGMPGKLPAGQKCGANGGAVLRMTQTAGKAEPRQIDIWEVAESKQAKKHMAWGSIAYGTLAQK